MCEKYNVSEKELRFGIRRNILVQARRAISWIRARELGYSGADVDKELMIYFLWQTGLFTNRKISELFGLSYSSVSRRVGIFREKLRVDKIFQREYDEISVLIKM